jgi:hypothetical protein
MKRIGLMIVICIGLGMPVIAKGQGLEYVSSELWTGVNDVAVSGNYAYCAFVNGLVVLDITNPATPNFVSRCYQSNEARGIELVGNYVYLASGTSGLRIMDVTSPTAPIEIGTFATSGPAKNLVVSGNYAYVINDSTGLQILDITNSANPQLIGSYSIPQLNGIFIRGNYAYLVANSMGLRILDISNPSNPSVVGNYYIQGYSEDVYVSGNYAYLAYSYNGMSSRLLIIDISDSTNPIPVSTTFILNGIYRILVEGNYAYLGDNGFAVYDISNPASPNRIDYLSGFNDRNMQKIGNVIFIACRDWGGLKIINVSNPSNPILTGSYDTPYYILSSSILGNYAYVVDLNDGLYILNIANPNNPVLITKITTSDSPYDVSISGNYAYVANSAGLQVFNISNPSNPMLVGSNTSLGYSYRIFISGNYAYMGSDCAFNIVSIANPSNPSLIGSLSTSTQVSNVDITGNYAYISNSSSILIINIADPFNPSLIRNFSTPGHVGNIEIAGNLAYVADNWGVLIYDISNPINPIQISSFTLPNVTFNDLTVHNNFAYVSTWSLGIPCIYILDISDNTNPTMVGSYRTNGGVSSIAIMGEYLYVSDHYSLMILHRTTENIREENVTLSAFSLSPSYPNPFNAQTTIHYALPAASDVLLDIFDITGRKIETLASGHKEAGEHQAVWNASGRASGIYFYRLKAGEASKTEKCILIK